MAQSMANVEKSAFTLRGMDHFTVLTTDVEQTRAFYDMLGFRTGPRPLDLPGPGLWFYVGDKPVLHVIGPVKQLDLKCGMLDHMAFRVTGLRAAARLLEEKNIKYRLQRLADPFGVWQMFFEDPFGARVEFDFDGEEPAPETWQPPVAR
jgi:catechol 2,3-dioxygenase-like lactoylglutathione lyase family enzyme